MEFKGTRESKIEEIKLRVKGYESAIITTKLSSEEMQFLMLENSRQMLNIAKVFLWTIIILPISISILYFWISLLQ
jgi:hypothetical protein